MGTYMSAFIEVDHSDVLPPFSDTVQICSLTEGSFLFGKDYEVFDALAWGRDSQMAPEDRDPARRPLIAPRGMPSPRSLAVAQSYFYLVAAPPDLPDRHFWPAHRCVPPGTAEGWVRERGALTSEVRQWFNWRPPRPCTWQVVADPVLYNASWLLLPEFDAALAHHGLRLEGLPVEYSVVRQALSLLGRRHGRERVRLVIWFS
jgi:hypothetical protein